MGKPDDTPAQAEAVEVEPKVGRMVRRQDKEQQAAEAKKEPPPDYPVVATREALLAMPQQSVIRVAIREWKRSVFIRTISG